MNTIATILQALLLVAFLVGIVTALAATLRHDGYGRRPAPRSHDGEERSSWRAHAA